MSISIFFFFKLKTAYEMRISDWSSDVCSSDLFSAYQAAPGVKVNGRLTLGENIADLGGLNVAYDALQAATANEPDTKSDDLTRDQRFFVGWETEWRGRYTPELEKDTNASAPIGTASCRARGGAKM